MTVKTIIDIGLTYGVKPTKDNQKKANDIFQRFQDEMKKEFPEAQVYSVYLHQKRQTENP